MKTILTLIAALLVALFAMGCPLDDSGDGANELVDNSGDGANGLADLIVNSLADLQDPPAFTVTLRSALAAAGDGQTIRFAPGLNGGTIQLSIVGEAHTILKGEVMGIREEPSGPVSFLVGYFDRDYGKSALYARKNVVIDASDLPAGITLAWVGEPRGPAQAAGDRVQARVLAVYGDLTMINVAVTGGASVAEKISTDDPDDQPWTLGRGGGVAVWGVARLVNCKLYGNTCEGDFESSRDRGAFGGGLYANIVDMQSCIVSGNVVIGGGAAGGGVFSVGGAGAKQTGSTIEQSTISGNRISGLFAYGAGVYSDGGGIGNRKTLELTNCTIAQNLVEYPFPAPFGYWRGGGVYISNGYLDIHSCTVVENQVHGVPRTDDLGKPNLAGGIAATIGNAHAVEDMTIGHSVIAGNTVHPLGGSVYEHDIFTGSLLYFRSKGHNRIGVIDFSQILVPVGKVGWATLCRRHYPKQGDMDGIDIAAVLDLAGGITRSDTILSAGVDASAPVALFYEPRGMALDQVPVTSYAIHETYAEYSVDRGGSDDFLATILNRLEDYYSLDGFADNFKLAFNNFLQTVDIDENTPGVQSYIDPGGNDILTLADTGWFGPAVTWPKMLSNYPYIEFWHRLDTALVDENISGLGPEIIGDDIWADLFTSGRLGDGDVTMLMWTTTTLTTALQPADQLGNPRPANALGDIGAVEVP